MKLPIMQSEVQELTMMQNRWAAIINPVLVNPLMQGLVLKNVQLSTGSNSVNHLLGRPLQGWFIVRQRGPASVYDTQDTNNIPNLTLLLVSDASVSVDLYVF